MGKALALLVLAACSGAGDQQPDEVARRFLRAAAGGDARAVFSLLDETTRAELGRLAARGSEQAGAGVRLRASEMIASGLRERSAPPPAVRMKERSADRCVVRIESGARSENLELHRENGEWRVRLDLGAR
ncbi:MAG: hypothetical protein AABZ30_09890 [Myxococcota bacterium]